MLAERINGRVICGYFPFGGRNNGSTARPHQVLGYAALTDLEVALLGSVLREGGKKG